MQVPIIFNDSDIIVVNKPNNMLVHSSYYARNIKTISLVNQLAEQGHGKLYPVHRLDHKTSGIIILAKSSESANHLQKQFEAGTISKTYCALLRGYSPKELVIDSPVKNPETGVYKEAYTTLNTLHSFEVDIPVQPYPKSRYSLVTMQPKTGRMHQLRKHANKISHPIIGDHKYGNRHHNAMYENELALPNLFLHAYAISFAHPVSGKQISLKADMPDFWKKMANDFNWDIATYL